MGGGWKCVTDAYGVKKGKKVIDFFKEKGVCVMHSLIAGAFLSVRELV